MSTDTKNNLSAVLILGIIFKQFPLKVIQPFLEKSIKIIQDKHPSIFNRLSEEEIDFVIDAIDLPFMFYLKISKSSPILKAIKKTEKPYPSATIKGTLINLLRLFEGKVDGDAMFFSKELTIEGSTATTVALRNAIDGEDMSILNDLSEIFYPFEELAKQAGLISVKNYVSIQDGINKISSSILDHTQKEVTSLKNRIYDLEEELDNINLSINKLKKEVIRKKSDYNNTQKKSQQIIT